MKDTYLSALGRFLMSVLFIGSGLSKIGAPDATIGYIASVGLPFATMVYGHHRVGRSGWWSVVISWFSNPFNRSHFGAIHLGRRVDFS
jgi:uncharacterized membrane protein YphA (DoxX/SURF4 family)